MASKQTNSANMVAPVAANMPSMIVEESRTVPDGNHTGVITKVVSETRGEEGFRYVDIHVSDDESGVAIKVGYPASRVTPETDLGQLLARFGASVVVGQAVNFGVLKGRVSFVTDTEKTKNGKFARVLRESLRPLA